MRTFDNGGFYTVECSRREPRSIARHQAAGRAAEEFDFAGQLAALIKRAQAAQAKGLAVKGLDALNDLVGVPSTPAADAEDAA